MPGPDSRSLTGGQVDGLQEAISALQESGGSIDGRVIKQMKEAQVVLERWASSAAPYKRGTLRRSIQRLPPSSERGRIIGIVGTKLIYARIQEEGGIIRAKHKPYLVFQVDGGDWVRTKQVTIPAQPYMEPSVKKLEPRYIHFMGKAVAESLQEIVDKVERG